MIPLGGNGSWDIIGSLLRDIPVPRMFPVRQNFPRPAPMDVVDEITRQFAERRIANPVRPGQTVAITVGSRGIVNMPLAVKTLAELIKKAGGKPFMVPAMGSHAGATAEGQMAMIQGMGFTEEYIGAPIRSSMEVVQLGTTKNNLPVLVDINAHEADHLIIINRIKPHVCFRGDYESGLMKMIAIGLGKQRGADFAHELGFHKMHEHIPEIARYALKRLKLLCAVGLVDSAHHETAICRVLLKDEIESGEPKLLAEAKALAAKLHFDKLDVLIIDEVGKNISGSGFDTNVVGRYHSPCISGGPQIHRIAILDISKESKGNGNGLGLADFTTKRAVEKFDFTQTYPNTLTATLTGSVKIPMTLPNDREAIQACLKTSNLIDRRDAAIVRIHNTLCLTEIEASENLRGYVMGHPDLEAIGDPRDLPFDSNGNLF